MSTFANVVLICDLRQDSNSGLFSEWSKEVEKHTLCIYNLYSNCASIHNLKCPRHQCIILFTSPWFKGSVSQDLQPLFLLFEPIWATDKQVFSNTYGLISPSYSITKLSPWCAAHRGTNVLSKSTFYTSNHFFHVFTHERTCPDCPFKSHHGQAKIFIFTPRFDAHCGDWLCGVMHTAEIDSVVWCTMRRLTLWCDAQCGDWLCGLMHTEEIDSVVWCTLRRLTLRCDAHCVGWLRGVMGAFM